jgi:hypothetical protein
MLLLFVPLDELQVAGVSVVGHPVLMIWAAGPTTNT